LGIERKQSLRLFRKSTRTGLPLQQAALAIEGADGVDIGNEVVLFADGSGELDLQILLRVWDLDTIVLAEPGQQHEALPEHTIPGVSVGVMQVRALAG
jgi:hypothetical protein